MLGPSTLCKPLLQALPIVRWRFEARKEWNNLNAIKRQRHCLTFAASVERVVVAQVFGVEH